MGKEVYLLKKTLKSFVFYSSERRWKGGLKSSYGGHVKFTVIPHAFYMKRHVVRSSLVEKDGDFGTTQTYSTNFCRFSNLTSNNKKIINKVILLFGGWWCIRR
jgi:hypothetical protein